MGTPAAPTAGHPKHSLHLLQLPAQAVPALGRALLALHGGAAPWHGGGRPQRGNLPGVHQALDVVICVLQLPVGLTGKKRFFNMTIFEFDTGQWETHCRSWSCLCRLSYW